MLKDSQLADGETVVFTAHAHWKAIAGPALLALGVTAAAVYALLVLVPDPQDQAWQRWLVIGLAVAVVLAATVRPLLSWFASTDTLTTRRLISRRGVLARHGRDIPIARVHSVSYRRSVLDRLLGSGTVVVQTAGHDSDVELRDVARLEQRILQIQEVILDSQIPAEGTDGRPDGV